MKRPIDLVIFDLDGTLADTARDLTDAVNFTRAHFHLSQWRDSAVLAHVGRGVEHLLRHSLPEESLHNFKAVLRVFLERYESHLLDATVLYPHVRETLGYFRAKRRAVVSNKIRRLALAVLGGLGVADCFDMILGGDSAPQKKPDPALLLHVLAGVDVAAERTVMIGDGPIDIEAGRRAGVLTCGVTYGLGQREDVIAAKPDVVIDDLLEIVRYFS